MKHILITCLLAAALLSATRAARAADNTSPTTTTTSTSKSEAKTKYMPFRGKISAVDKSAKTITLAGKTKSRTFLLKDDTRIHNDGKPAVIDDVQPGALVGGRARATATGEWELVVLNLGIKGAKQQGKTGTTDIATVDDSME